MGRRTTQQVRLRKPTPIGPPQIPATGRHLPPAGVVVSASVKCRVGSDATRTADGRIKRITPLTQAPRLSSRPARACPDAAHPAPPAHSVCIASSHPSMCNTVLPSESLSSLAFRAASKDTQSTICSPSASARFGLVVHFVRHCASHSASWVFHVARSSWNQVDMRVHDRLSGRLTAVHTDIEAGYRSVRRADAVPHHPNQILRVTVLLSGHREEIRRMLEGHDQRMPFADGVFVQDCEDRTVPFDDTPGNIRRAERTIRIPL